MERVFRIALTYSTCCCRQNLDERLEETSALGIPNFLSLKKSRSWKRNVFTKFTKSDQAQDWHTTQPSRYQIPIVSTNSENEEEGKQWMLSFTSLTLASMGTTTSGKAGWKASTCALCRRIRKREESVHCRLTQRRLVHLLRRRPANTLGNGELSLFLSLLSP